LPEANLTESIPRYNDVVKISFTVLYLTKQMVQKPNYATVTTTQWLSQLCLPWNLKLKKTRKGRQTSRQSFWTVLLYCRCT